MNTGLTDAKHAQRPVLSGMASPSPLSSPAPNPYADSSNSGWLQAIIGTLRARHLIVLAVVLLLPLAITPFLLYQVAGQALVIGLIALSLTFLGGYGGMVSLAQMTVAGIAGYTVAILGLAETYGLAYAPTYSVVFTFLILIAVLAFRPRGIMGRTT